METYDPLADIVQLAAECSENDGQITKAATLRRLELVLRQDVELSKELQRRIAKRLNSEAILAN